MALVPGRHRALVELNLPGETVILLAVAPCAVDARRPRDAFLVHAPQGAFRYPWATLE